jgi:hypothetical protein
MALPVLAGFGRKIEKHHYPHTAVAVEEHGGVY